VEESDLGPQTFGKISQARDSSVRLFSLAIYRKYSNCFAEQSKGCFLTVVSASVKKQAVVQKQ
jgi:hypothetical protein